MHTCLRQYTKVHSKLIKDLNIKPETVKVLEEYIGGMLLTSILAMFSGGNLTPNVKATKIKVNK